MLDLDAPGALRVLADTVKADIDIKTSVEGKYAWRIKPSMLAGACVAKLWYMYRWAAKSDIPGPKARTFNRGTEAERRMIAYLRQGGWQIEDIDPAKAHKKEFNQFNFKAVDGHVSAYLDGKAWHETFTQNTKFLLELKTMAKSKFNQLVAKQFVRMVNPEYYGQVCMYMQGQDLPFCLFVCECTEDQELYLEIIRRDDETANRALGIAQTIKDSRSRPSRVSESPAFGMCKSCTFLDICHYDKPMDKNCRSCEYCIPAPDGKFYCDGWQLFIPGDKIELGCSNHKQVV